ncbi:hypothetical protein [Dokdonella sp.]|uniref:hypothetical protein n=1 Tax=Dokdonella sp. TaxID=2291710 RepID=UPI001AFDF61D|nr:hypothetical protein [Dokdonella sp.]MBO9664790.1 hypothetical protein [Dokdonella sp.]
MNARHPGGVTRRYAFASCFLLVLGLAACSDEDMCGNEIVTSVASPSGILRAVVFTRDCGATTGYSTQLSILPAAEALPRDGGNTLILDDQIPLTVRWISDTELLVKGIGSAKVFRREQSVAGVQVRVEP